MINLVNVVKDQTKQFLICYLSFLESNTFILNKKTIPFKYFPTFALDFKIQNKKNKKHEKIYL